MKRLFLIDDIRKPIMSGYIEMSGDSYISVAKSYAQMEYGKNVRRADASDQTPPFCLIELGVRDDGRKYYKGNKLWYQFN